MQKEREAFNAFLRMNAKKASATDSPVAHVQFHSASMPPEAPLLVMDQSDILNELDKNSLLVQWLLRQLATYDCARQKIVALVFDKQTVLSDVLWDVGKINNES